MADLRKAALRQALARDTTSSPPSLPPTATASASPSSIGPIQHDEQAWLSCFSSTFDIASADESSAAPVVRQPSTAGTNHDNHDVQLTAVMVMHNANTVVPIGRISRWRARHSVCVDTWCWPFSAVMGSCCSTSPTTCIYPVLPPHHSVLIDATTLNVMVLATHTL
jgi:hypothetical protein